jgi:hypothetical protein
MRALARASLCHSDLVILSSLLIGLPRRGELKPGLPRRSAVRETAATAACHIGGERRGTCHNEVRGQVVLR